MLQDGWVDNLALHPRAQPTALAPAAMVDRRGAASLVAPLLLLLLLDCTGSASAVDLPRFGNLLSAAFRQAGAGDWADQVLSLATAGARYIPREQLEAVMNALADGMKKVAPALQV